MNPGSQTPAPLRGDSNERRGYVPPALPDGQLDEVGPFIPEEVLEITDKVSGRVGRALGSEPPVMSVSIKDLNGRPMYVKETDPLRGLHKSLLKLEGTSYSHNIGIGILSASAHAASPEGLRIALFAEESMEPDEITFGKARVVDDSNGEQYVAIPIEVSYLDSNKEHTFVSLGVYPDGHFFNEGRLTEEEFRA